MSKFCRGQRVRYIGQPYRDRIGRVDGRMLDYYAIDLEPHGTGASVLAREDELECVGDPTPVAGDWGVVSGFFEKLPDGTLYVPYTGTVANLCTPQVGDQVRIDGRVETIRSFDRPNRLLDEHGQLRLTTDQTYGVELRRCRLLTESELRELAQTQN